MHETTNSVHLNVIENTRRETATNEPIPQRTMEENISKKKLAFLWVKFIILSSLFLLDIYSDIALGMLHFKSGDNWWGGLTLFFVFLPWCYSNFRLHIIQNGKCRGPFGFTCNSRFQTCRDYMCTILRCEDGIPFSTILNLFGLGSIASNFKALTMETKGEKSKSVDYGRQAGKEHYVIIVFEDLPQLALQCYIMAANNEIKILGVITILTSSFSASYGITSAISMWVDHYLEKENRGRTERSTGDWKFIVGLTPFVALMIITTVPTVSLYMSVFASTKQRRETGDANWYALLILSPLFSFVYLFVITITTLTILPKEYTRLPGNELKNLLGGFLFTLVWFFMCADLLVARWIVTISSADPLMNGTSIHGIPAFIWPDTIPPLESSKVFNNISLPKWARCASKKSNESAYIPSLTNTTGGYGTNISSPTVPGSFFTTLTTGTWCLTDFRVPIFLVIANCTIILVVYHFILLLMYFKIGESIINRIP